MAYGTPSSSRRAASRRAVSWTREVFMKNSSARRATSVMVTIGSVYSGDPCSDPADFSSDGIGSAGMSEPTTGSVRVRELLTESRKARALRERLVAAGQDPSAVDEALDGLYADLGRAFVIAVENGETSIPV